MVSEKRKIEIIDYMRELLTENGRWDIVKFVDFTESAFLGWDMMDEMVDAAMKSPEYREALCELIRQERMERGWAVPNGK
jgi:hypothetical protein